MSPGDRILCVASAGEVPLELLMNSHESIGIDAIDIALPQQFLSNLKLQASLLLERLEAARFLGYLPTTHPRRKILFEKIKPHLCTDEVQFWINNPIIFEKGPVHLGRYERYISRFAPLGRWLLGGQRKISGLFECPDIEDQKKYFDHVLRTRLLKNLFRIMFHERLYKNRGVSARGLLHLDEHDLGLKFFRKFRDFCTNSSARHNYLLQYTLFNQVLFIEALPGYLGFNHTNQAKYIGDRLHFKNISYTDSIKTSPQGKYNKFVFSNISDWIRMDEFVELIHLTAEKAGRNSRGIFRFIHSTGLNQMDFAESILIDDSLGEKLLKQDRFPFYHIVPFKVKDNPTSS